MVVLLDRLLDREVVERPERLVVDVAFTLALELAERAARAPDDAARSAAVRIRGAGASRPVRLSEPELTALAEVIDAWEAEAETARRLRELLS